MLSLLGPDRSTPSFPSHTTSPITPSRKSGYLHALSPPRLQRRVAGPFTLARRRRGELAKLRATSALVTLLPLRRRGELAPETPWSEGEAPAEYEIEVDRATRVLIRDTTGGVLGGESTAKGAGGCQLWRY